MTGQPTQTTNASLLLVDDDHMILDSMGSWLREIGYDVQCAASLNEGKACVDNNEFDLILADIRLGDGDGFELLEYSQKQSPDTAVIMLTGYGTVDMAVDAVRMGAFDLLTKPVFDEDIKLAIDRALEQKNVIEENENLKTQLDQQFGLSNVVGNDHRMLKMFDVIQSVADTRATILVTGESGTGKSLIARAIHRASNRENKPFVEVACGALPENLLESELFGHVAGSFTGATTDKIGKFKQADGGTLFLDEIGTASMGLQVKLLRVLQELQFEQVGGSKTFSVDTRVILATNEDLQKAVDEGRFRQDLYYRVNVINLELPSLRERISDIPSLAEHFLKIVCEDTGKRMDGFTSAAITALQQYNWPGNVRELQNIVERAVLLGKQDQIGVEDLPSQITQGIEMVPTLSAEHQTLKEALEGPERQIILRTLKQFNWNRNATADSLGINRTTLYKKMKKLGLEEQAQALGF